MCDDNQDINDVFYDIALIEDKIVNNSYKEGYSQGLQSGNTESYHFGFHRGAEIGAELGFYWGFLENPQKVTNKKHSEAIGKLKTLINRFPDENNPEEDFVAKLEEIRIQFRKICAFLRIKNPQTLQTTSNSFDF